MEDDNSHPSLNIQSEHALNFFFSVELTIALSLTGLLSHLIIISYGSLLHRGRRRESISGPPRRATIMINCVHIN